MNGTMTHPVGSAEVRTAAGGVHFFEGAFPRGGSAAGLTSCLSTGLACGLSVGLAPGPPDCVVRGLSPELRGELRLGMAKAGAGNSTSWSETEFTAWPQRSITRTGAIDSPRVLLISMRQSEAPAVAKNGWFLSSSPVPEE